MIFGYAPDCNPLSFIREMDASPSFNGPNMMSASDRPSMGQIPQVALEDCSEYYWRAKALILGYTSPWSSTFSFETDFNDSCPGQPVELLPTSTSNLTPPQATDTPLPTATSRRPTPTPTQTPISPPK